ncbi:MAG TPA: transporter substrate-binding domain-containing protein [bacterium]|nr:transporter substrate-binding domain-containing protein [bacterium]
MYRAAVPVLALLLVGCGPRAAQTPPMPNAPRVAASGPTVDRIRHEGVMRVAADLSYPPMAYRRDGTPAGFDVDLATLLAASLGVRLRVIDTPLSTMAGVGVPAGADAVLGGIPEGVVPGLSSGPYYVSRQAILSIARRAVESPRGLRGLHVAVAVGGRGAAVARDAGAILDVTALPEQALDEVALGRAQAAVADAPLVFNYAAEHPGLRATGGVGAPVPFVVVVPREAHDLATFVSAALHDLDRDGGLAQLRARWHL